MDYHFGQDSVHIKHWQSLPDQAKCFPIIKNYQVEIFQMLKKTTRDGLGVCQSCHIGTWRAKMINLNWADDLPRSLGAN